MKKKTVFEYFRPQLKLGQSPESYVSHLLGYSRQAVSQWTDIIPPIAAIKLWALTNQELELDPKAWDKVGQFTRKKK